jgi:hypothetical protein
MSVIASKHGPISAHWRVRLDLRQAQDGSLSNSCRHCSSSFGIGVEVVRTLCHCLRG